MTPVKLSLKEQGMLSIHWDDNSEARIKLSNLRKKCPCAICNSDSKERGAKYIPIYTREQLTVSKISIVGSYAVGVEWQDGHNTGIYDFNYLRKICDWVQEVSK